MDIKALVLYCNAYALYLVTKENDNIYTATLQRYDGNDDVLPPDCITVTKSYRSWKGSTDMQSLVDELGEIIEYNFPADNSKKQNNSNPIEDAV